MKLVHSMPFGAEVAESGTTRFALWAPGARDAWLRLEGPSRHEELRMQAEPGRRLSPSRREGAVELAAADLFADLPVAAVEAFPESRG